MYLPETVARIDALGHVNRRLVAVAMAAGREHRAGTEVTADEGAGIAGAASASAR